MSRREFSKEEIDLVYKLYVEQQQSLRKTKEQLHCSEDVLKRLIIEQGWHLRTIQETNSKNFPPEIVDQIVDWYINEKTGLCTIAKRLGCTDCAIRTALKHRGIVLRTYTEAKQEGRKYTINDDFFKYQNHEMAYILGLIAADGSVSQKENSVSIQLRDYDAHILEQIKEIMQSSRPIDYYTDSKGIQYTKFQVWSKSIKDDLAKYGIVPNKTFILTPPTFLAKEFYISYILGYFDGDGCITSANNTPTFSIEGASKPLIEWIRQVFANEYGITNNGLYIKYTDKGTPIYNNVYYGDKCLAIYKELYKKSSLFLKRKYQKFTELICPRDSISLD